MIRARAASTPEATSAGSPERVSVWMAETLATTKSSAALNSPGDIPLTGSTGSDSDSPHAGNPSARAHTPALNHRRFMASLLTPRLHAQAPLRAHPARVRSSEDRQRSGLNERAPSGHSRRDR